MARRSKVYVVVCRGEISGLINIGVQSSFWKSSEDICYDIKFNCIYTNLVHTVNLGDKEQFDKEQISVKEPFPLPIF